MARAEKENDAGERISKKFIPAPLFRFPILFLLAFGLALDGLAAAPIEVSNT